MNFQKQEVVLEENGESGTHFYSVFSNDSNMVSFTKSSDVGNSDKMPEKVVHDEEKYYEELSDELNQNPFENLNNIYIGDLLKIVDRQQTIYKETVSILSKQLDIKK